MNPNVQAAVDEVYQNSEYKDVVSSSGQRLQSAITVVDNVSGEVVAMAGGLGEKTVSRSLNRATSSKRPPGSSIKPLSVYAPAIELGKVKPTTTVEDSPVDKIARQRLACERRRRLPRQRHGLLCRGAVPSTPWP